jgi:hypothetical protein
VLAPETAGPDREHKPARGRKNAKINDASYLEALVSEVHATAVSVAVVISVINSFSNWKIHIDPSAVASFTPETGPLKALLRNFDEIDAGVKFEAPFALEFIQGIEAANAPLQAYIKDCQTIGPSRAGALHVGRLKPVWQPLRRLTAILVQAWQDTLPIKLPELYGQNVQVITDLLAGASVGFRPCLDANGKLYVPPLPQKRRWPRRIVLEDCKVFHDGRVRKAFLRDASAGGFGLDMISGLRRGDTITVELTTGRRFDGMITWISGSEAGMKFSQPRAANDPLIIG